jgi:N-succinyldiaminopimelate aminotransferase
MPDQVLPGRLREFGTTIFTEITALAQQAGAINLGQGFPDSDGPESTIAAARRALESGLNQYPPLMGLPELRSAISGQRLRDYGMNYDPATEVLVTFGATEAITASILAICEAGDEVVVFEPYYDAYAAAIAIAGATRVVVPLTPSAAGFVFDAAELAAAIGPRTRALILNSPHNPTGKVFSADELRCIADLCKRHDLVAITDEVYEHIIFDGRRHLPLASMPGMRERTISISSAGKTLSFTGWKIGWACAPAPLIAAVRTVKQYLTFAGGGPFQAAVAYALDCERSWTPSLRADLQRKRNLLGEALAESGVRVYPSAGTYFLQLDVRSFGYRDAGLFCRELPYKAGVAAVPTSAFCDNKQASNHLARLAFCKKDETLALAADRLAAFARVTREQEL